MSAQGSSRFDAAPNVSVSGTSGQESLEALPRAGVVSLANGHGAQDHANPPQELFTPIPAQVLDEDARREAIEPRVRDEQGGNVLSLVGEITLVPRPGNDDHRADVSQLGRDGLVQEGLVLCLSSRTVRLARTRLLRNSCLNR